MLDSRLNHRLHLIPVYLKMGLIHSYFFGINHTYHNIWLKFPSVNIPINGCTNREYFWSHFRIQHPTILEHFTLHRWTSHNASKKGTWKVLGEKLTVLSSPLTQITWKPLCSFTSNRNNFHVLTCLVLPPTLHLLIKLTAPLLLIPIMIGNFTFNCSDINILIKYSMSFSQDTDAINSTSVTHKTNVLYIELFTEIGAHSK